MKRSILSLLSVGGVIGATVVVQSTAEPAPTAPTSATVTQVRAKAKEILGALPTKMPGAEKDTPALIELGRKLYFDTRLSANQTQSCNSCHAVDKNSPGVDGERTSPGAFGKRGNRNSPTVLNAGLHFTQFWDGRAPTLEEQAKGPILNPVEMGMKSEAEVIARIASVKEYQTLFGKAFPAAAEKITYDNLARAIAAFERTLITRDRFDDFLKGVDRALSPTELAGLNKFLEIGCTTCHGGELIGAGTFQKVGLVNPYENATDLGRAEITKDDSDKFKFKVPSLRNVALTSPYFHDGATAKLEEAVAKMAWMQLGLKLDEADTKNIVAFLNALSDKDRAAKATKRA